MDVNLRARIRDGDPTAFRQLFDDHARGIYNHGFRLVGDWSTAQDVVSLTFLEAWRLRESVDADGGSLRPWLYGIATNVVRNTARAARRHRAALARMGEPEPVPDFAGEVVTRLDDHERVDAVLRAVRGLRRLDREVFALCVWEGLDHASAAEALGVAVGTVRSRLSRARVRLKQLVDKELEEKSEPHGGRGQLQGSRHKVTRSTQEIHR